MNTNECVFTGNLTRKPICRYTGSGSAVASFTIAVNGAKKEEKPLFLDCVAWEKKAELVTEHLDKGSKVLVIGRMGNREWTGNDGAKRVNFELTVEKIEFLSQKKSADTSTDIPADEERVSAANG